MFFHRRVAIVGICRQTVQLLAQLLQFQSFEVVRIVDTTHESLCELEKVRGLSLIIDTTGEPRTLDILHSLMLQDALIITRSEAQHLLIAEHTALVTTRGLESLKSFLSIACSSLRADSGVFVLRFPNGTKMCLETDDGANFRITDERSKTVEWGSVTKVFKEGTSIISKEPSPDHKKHELERFSDHVSYLSVALEVNSSIIGVLQLCSIRFERKFDRNDREKLEEICMLGPDILGYPEMHSGLISRSISDSFDRILLVKSKWVERLRLLLLKMACILKAQQCNYYSFDESKQVFFRTASSSPHEEVVGGKMLKLNDHLASKLLNQRETVLMHLREKGAGAGKWYIVHPLIIEGNLKGALYAHIVSNRSSKEYERDIIIAAASKISREMQIEEQVEIANNRTVRYLAMLEACSDLTKAGSSIEVAELAAANACLIMEAQSCILRLLDRNNELTPIASYCFGSKPDSNQIEQIDEKIAPVVFSGAVPRIFDSNTEDLSSFLNGSVKTGMSMWLARDGKKFGTLSLYNRHTQNPGACRFSESDKDIFLHYCLQTEKALGRFI